MGSKSISFYLIALVAAVIGAVGDGLLNHWAKRPQQTTFLSCLAGFAAWNLALVLFSRLLAASSLARAVILFLVANSIAAAMLSVFYFHERFTSLQWLGMAVAIVGIVIMEVAK